MQDGPDGGVPLVLLQRFRGTTDDWDPAFINVLSADRRVIRFDSAGIGRSEGRVPQVMSQSGNDAADFLFYPESETSVAAGKASLDRIAEQSNVGPAGTAEAFMAQIKAISTWPGVLHRAKELRMPVLVASGAHDVILPAYRSYVLSQQAPDAKLILYPDAGHAFLFQEIDDFATQIDLLLE